MESVHFYGRTWGIIVAAVLISFPIILSVVFGTLPNGEVLVKYDWYDHQGRGDRAEYKADADFLAKLQKVKCQ